MSYHIRRKDKEITDQKQMRKILETTKYVTLAMVKHGEPYLVSLSHAYDKENHCIYFHCASEGKKLDYLKDNPLVWGQALLDHGYYNGECSHLFASVMFKGKVEFIRDLEEKRHAFRAMILQLEPDPDSIMDDLLSSNGLPTTVVAKVKIEYMTGKKSAEVTL
jgi:nitroimidazol reductase NimA-like FMN-containing flavoprotein (pyridoxamine 5'-phosphate oxidase superfamily)